MIDVLIASGIMSLLVVVVGGLLAVTARSELASSISSDAAVTASDIASEASALGCGAATGYGTGAQASSLLSACAWGPNGGPYVHSLGDVAGPGLLGPSTAYCPAQAQDLPGPACYPVPGLAGASLTVGVDFSWEWSVPSAQATDLATVLDGSKVTSPPDVLVTKAVVAWQDGTNRDSHAEVSYTVRSALPNVLSTGWAAGGMGVVVVDLGTSPEVSVRLDMPSTSGWPTGPVVTSYAQGGSQYAVFPYVPAGSYQVQVLGGAQSPAFPVGGGKWSVVYL